MIFLKKHPVLKLVLFSRIKFRLLIILLSIAATFFGLLTPFIQKEFIDSISKSNNSPLHEFFINYWPFEITDTNTLIIVAFFSFLASLLFTQLCNYLGQYEAIQMQKILAEKVYQQNISLRLDSLSNRPVGEIVSIYATDVPGSTIFLEQTIPSGLTTFFPFILAPFAVSYFFDFPLWPTVIIMVLVASINTALALRQSKFFFKFKKLAAIRIGYVNEWIQNIRALRILNWVEKFEEKIKAIRIIETDNRVGMVTNGQLMNSISSTVTFFLNISAIYLLIHSTHRQITGGELLALLWIVGIFLTRPFRQMPWFFTMGFDSWSSILRLEEYLKIENRTSFLNSQDIEPPSKKETQLAIEIKNLKLEIQNKTILNNISLNIKKGDFVVIIGEVGSGKSLLLLSLLHETGAQVEVYNLFGKNVKSISLKELGQFFSFVPQESFIMNSSLRDNVHFSYDSLDINDHEIINSLDKSQFNLTKERTENGLNTEIGERGVNLSGGQKQRVSLARAVFKDSPIVLLDDCLSAVDVDTEKQLIKNLINDSWRLKTRIIATHRLSVLEHADWIIFLKDGEILKQGTLPYLKNHCPEFIQFTEKNLKSTQAPQENNRETL